VQDDALDAAVEAGFEEREAAGAKTRERIPPARARRRRGDQPALGLLARLSSS